MKHMALQGGLGSSSSWQWPQAHLEGNLAADWKGKKHKTKETERWMQGIEEVNRNNELLSKNNQQKQKVNKKPPTKTGSSETKKT